MCAHSRCTTAARSPSPGRRRAISLTAATASPAVRVCRRMAPAPRSAADGVWSITRGFPLRINVFFVREGDGVAVFDTGHKPMGAAVRAGRRRARRRDARDPRQPARRSPRRRRRDRRADPLPRRRPRGRRGRRRRALLRLRPLPFLVRGVTRRRSARGTAGRCRSRARWPRATASATFEVVHLPGHSPGCIGLWRAADRLAITNDCFALFHPAFPFPGRRPRVPHPAFNWSTRAARSRSPSSRRSSRRPAGRRTTGR